MSVPAPLVLIVDDSALVTEALTILLEAVGYGTASAGSVSEAVRAARDLRPDALLLDLTLPDGEGLDVLHALGDDDGVAPVAIALTGHDDPETATRCLDAGCRAVLTKPVRAAALVQALVGAGLVAGE